MTPSMREKLNKLGLDMEKSEKHPDGAFFDDDRYQLVCSSTPSDLHANDQNWRYIKKHFF